MGVLAKTHGRVGGAPAVIPLAGRRSTASEGCPGGRRKTDGGVGSRREGVEQQ